MIKVHKSLRKALSILTFVGMFMSSTGMAFVPVAYAEDVLENQHENLEAGQGLESGGDSITPAVSTDNNAGLDAPVQSFGPGFGFGYSKSKLKNKVINHLIEKFGGLDKPTICAEGDTIHISLGNKKESVTFSDLPSELIILLSFVGIESVSDLGLPECPSPEPEPDPEPSITLNTTKIVCEFESSLPNWQGSSSATGITTEDAITYANNNDGCDVVDDWEFQWTPGTVAPTESGSYVGALAGVWNTIPAGSVTIPISEITNGAISVREVLQDGYIPFTFDENNKSNADNVTAEFYCSGAGLNYDNLEWVRNLTDGDEVDCVAFNAPTGDQVPENPQTATVEMCKLDTNENYLSGWQLALLGSPVKTTSVDSKENKASHPVNVDLPAGDYVAKATGTFKYRSGTNLTADARFSERLPGDATYGGPYSPWATSSSGTAWLHMDGNATVWGDVFSPSHTYYAPITLTSDRDVEFYIGDNQHKDNKGNINVDIYNGYTGVTGDNGCVTFEGVPYGDYTVEELLQPEWENKSGLGAVTISGDITLNVINQGPEDLIGRCELGDVDMWAASVEDFNQGVTKSGDAFQGGRSDTNKALGSNTSDFVSLGFGGEIVLEFSTPFVDAPGADIRVHEITNGFTFAEYPETAEVSVSENGTDWTVLGEAKGTFVNEFDLADASYTDAVRYIKIKDTSDKDNSGFPNNHTADGFDLAAIEVLGCEPGEEPEPEDEFSISGTKTEVINGDEAMGEGWEIELYRLVDTVEVDSEESTAVSSSVSLTNSTQYLLEVSGTYKFGNPNRRADAEYTSEIGDWTDVANDTYEDDFLDLLVDGVARDWGEFDSSHTYYLPFTGTGSAVSFLIKDRAFAYGDNEGVLTVRIFEFEDDDETDSDGEYSFDGLDEGTYLVREVNQEGWTQVMPEIGHCEISLSVDNQEGECDFVNHQDGDVPTNPQEGTLQVRKLVLGTNTTGTGNFEITVTCDNGMNTTAVLGANGYVRYTLPVGTSCTVSEVNPGGAAVTYAPSATVTIDDGGDVITWIDVTNDFRDNGNGDNQGPASSTPSRSFASGRVLGDSTSTLEDDNGEVLGATTSIYPEMPNAGHTSAFSGSLVLAVQALVIGAALFFHNRKMFGTRVGELNN